MKNRILLSFFGLLFFVVFASAGNIDVSSVNYDPTPASPGDTITLWVHLTNNSSVDSKNVAFTLNLKSENSGTNYPFSLVSSETALKNVGTVIARQTALVKYQILVDSKTPDGLYKINLESGEDNVIQKSTPYTIRVLSRKPTLAVISANPTSAEIGKKTSLEIILQNTGSSNAFNINVRINEDRTVTSTGVVVERDIVPLGAATTNIASLGISEKTTATIPLLINPSATPKAYFVPVSLEFYDENKTKYTQTDYIGIKVFNDAELGASVSEVKPLLAAGQDSKISVDIFNTGLGTAKYLVVKAKTDFASLKQGEFFIGSLESDDSDTVSLDAHVASNENTGTHFAEITMVYKNQYGEEQTVVKKLPVVLYTPAEIAKQSQQESPMLLYLGLIVAAGIIVYWLLKKRRKKK